MTEAELLRHYIEQYADLDMLDLKTLRDGYRERVQEVSGNIHRLRYLEGYILSRLVATTMLHDLRLENVGSTPYEYNFQQLLSPDLQRRVSIAQKLIPDLTEKEKKVTELCQKIAEAEGHVSGDAVRQMFREAGYRGDAEGQGKREKDFQELVDLITFSARLGRFYR